MWRRTRQLAVVVSAILAIGIAVIWVRSEFVRDEFQIRTVGHLMIGSSFREHAHFVFAPWQEAANDVFLLGLDQYPRRPKYWQPRFERFNTGTEISIPYWLPLIFFSAGPAYALVVLLRRRSRERLGLCQSCGYDIRFSADRCPECGAPITPPDTAERCLT